MGKASSKLFRNGIVIFKETRMTIIKRTVTASLFAWSSLLWSADSIELEYRNDMYIREFDGTTFRLFIDRINTEKILDNIKNINAPRFIAFVKYAKDDDAIELGNALKDAFPNFSIGISRLGSKCLIVEVASNDRYNKGRGFRDSHLSYESINQKSLISYIGSVEPSPTGRRRIVWFFEKASTNKMSKLVNAIRQVHPLPSNFKITTWLISSKSGMIEIDWS